MKYYKLSNSLNIKEIGKYPQDDGKIIKIGSLGGINGDYSLGAFGKINIIKEFPEPYVSPKAKLTSLLYVGAISNRFLVINHELLDCLRKFEINDFQKWQIKTHYKNQIYDNYNLFIIDEESQSNLIDFSLSHFSIKKIMNSEIEYNKQFVDYEDYLNTLKSLDEDLVIRCNKLVINLENNHFDMFRLGRLPLLNGYIISERLKKAIEEESFTGISFKEIHEIDDRIEVK